jgi:hypothetical protein
MPGRREMHEVALHMTPLTKREVDKGRSPHLPAREGGKAFLQSLRLGREPIGILL